MPKVIKQNYALTGPARVLIYSEQEMAVALGMSVAELHKAIKECRFCYHGRPETTGAGYDFNQGAYERNVAWRACETSGGHKYALDGHYDERLGKRKWICRCGREKYDP